MFDNLKKITSIVLACLFIIGCISVFAFAFSKQRKNEELKNDSVEISKMISFSIYLDSELLFEESVKENTTWNTYIKSNSDLYMLIENGIMYITYESVGYNLYSYSFPGIQGPSDIIIDNTSYYLQIP